eukprot:8078672-Pyramimonas_sp.AAC.1
MRARPTGARGPHDIVWQGSCPERTRKVVRMNSTRARGSRVVAFGENAEEPRHSPRIRKRAHADFF